MSTISQGIGVSNDAKFALFIVVDRSREEFFIAWDQMDNGALLALHLIGMHVHASRQPLTLLPHPRNDLERSY